jgi:hypothetical protein
LKGFEVLRAEEVGHDLVDETFLVVHPEGFAVRHPTDDVASLTGGFLITPFQQQVKFPRKTQLLRNVDVLERGGGGGFSCRLAG